MVQVTKREGRCYGQLMGMTCERMANRTKQIRDGIYAF